MSFALLLNGCSRGLAELLTPMLQRETGLPVLGCFPVQKSLHLESRHLGLKMPQEMEGLRKQVNQAAEKLEETADLDRMLQLLQSWALLHAFRDGKTKLSKLPEPGKEKEILQKRKKQQEECPVIAVAKDEAFCFYYEDNLRLLEAYGGKLVWFSPLGQEKIPEEADALLLGGGYPELCARQLSENVSMRNSIREAIENGMPSVAECGGFMYLHESMTDEEGENWPMAGIITGSCHNRGKLVRFGYVNVMEQTSHFLAGKPVRAHEFHYYDSEDNGVDCIATKPTIGRNYPCIHVGENHWYGFPHLYYPSCPEFAEQFVEKAAQYKNRFK